jgi:hypothetical protein
VVVTPGKTATSDNVRDAILRAGSSLGWTMRATAPGVVNGQIHKNYNGWIEDLNHAIRWELMRV